MIFLESGTCLSETQKTESATGAGKNRKDSDSISKQSHQLKSQMVAPRVESGELPVFYLAGTSAQIRNCSNLIYDRKYYPQIRSTVTGVSLLVLIEAFRDTCEVKQ